MTRHGEPDEGLAMSMIEDELEPFSKGVRKRILRWAYAKMVREDAGAGVPELESGASAEDPPGAPAERSPALAAQAEAILNRGRKPAADARLGGLHQEARERLARAAYGVVAAENAKTPGKVVSTTSVNALLDDAARAGKLEGFLAVRPDLTLDALKRAVGLGLVRAVSHHRWAVAEAKPAASPPSNGAPAPVEGVS